MITEDILTNNIRSLAKLEYFISNLFHLADYKDLHAPYISQLIDDMRQDMASLENCDRKLGNYKEMRAEIDRKYELLFELVGLVEMFYSRKK